MKPELHIVGTVHHLQFGAGNHSGGYRRSASDQEAFIAMLSALAAAVSADVIAKELSVKALHEAGAEVSVPSLVAAALGLPHLFCAPDRSERAALQIHEDAAIRVSNFPGVVSETEFEHARRKL